MTGMSCMVNYGTARLAMPFPGTVKIQGKTMQAPVAAACSSSEDNPGAVWAYAICCMSTPPQNGEIPDNGLTVNDAAVMDNAWLDWTNTQGLTTDGSLTETDLLPQCCPSLSAKSLEWVTGIAQINISGVAETIPLGFSSQPGAVQCH